eukprot:1646375-Amphidinium_carterae.1
MLQLAYEYQGEYHYDSENYYNTLPGRDFQSVVVRDAIKQVLCSRAGIRLVVVPYFVKHRWSFILMQLRETISTMFTRAEELAKGDCNWVFAAFVAGLVLVLHGDCDFG